MKKIAILLLSIFIFSCEKIYTTTVEINQSVEEASITNAESRIVTTVDVKNCLGRKSSIEYIGWEVVPNELVDSLKIIEYNKAIPKFIQAKKICKCEGKLHGDKTYSISDDIDRMIKIITIL